MISEPDVTLTDYGLAIECAAFAWLLYRRGRRGDPLRASFILFFASTGLAALTGGTVHGFFPDERGWGTRILWQTTLLAIGLAALAGWRIGAWIQFSPIVARRISLATALQFAIYGCVILAGTATFAVAILNYLPAAVFVLVVLAVAYRRTRRREMLLALGGVALTFVASAVQQTGVGLHPVYFNHNALFHLIQGVALFLIFWGARRLIGARAME